MKNTIRWILCVGMTLLMGMSLVACTGAPGNVSAGGNAATSKETPTASSTSASIESALPIEPDENVYKDYVFSELPTQELPGNAGVYSVEQTEAAESSLLQGKTIIFLGSSVAQGTNALGESMVDYLEKIDGIHAVKEAVAGTLLVDENLYGESYITRMKQIDTSIQPDAFICQLSTNDATMQKTLGKISDSTNLEDFDTKKVTGAIEYIIAYAKETWNCPVIFFTGTRFESLEYTKMVTRLLALQEKWDIGVIDLWNDEEMHAVSEENYTLYMSDEIHPTKAGYRDWWTPKFESYLTEYLEKN